MVTIREATQADGAPDTQWGYNDIALTFQRDNSGALPTRAGEVNIIYNSDGDPSSGLAADIVNASHGAAPTADEVEARLPFRLTPEDQILRYHVPNSTDTYLVVRRPIYTDRCDSSATGTVGNIFNMSPSLANALAFVGGRDNATQWCADRRPQREPGNGRFRMITPFDIEGTAAHAAVRTLRTALDRIESAKSNPASEQNPLIRSLAAAISVDDIEGVRGQINESLGVTGRVGYFVDEHPALSATIALGMFISTAVGFGFFTPFGDKLHRRFFGGGGHGEGNNGGQSVGTGGRSVPLLVTTDNTPPARPTPPSHERPEAPEEHTPPVPPQGPTASPRTPQEYGVEPSVDASVDERIDPTALPSESDQTRRFGPEIRQRHREQIPTGVTIPSAQGLNYLDYGVLGLAAVTTAIVGGPMLLTYLGISGAETTAAAGTVTAGAELTAGLTAEQAILLRVGEAFTTANASGLLGAGGIALEGARRAAPVIQRVIEQTVSH